MRPAARLLVLAMCLGGCDSGGAGKPDAAAAAAADKAKKEQEATDAAVAKRKAAREAEEKAKTEADDKRRAELKRLTTLPESLPKKPPTCEDVGAAHDAFIRRVGDADTVAKWDGGGKDEDLPMTIVRCAQADSFKVAICQTQALAGAGAEFAGHEEDLLKSCVDQHGKGGGKPGMVPPKPGG